MGNPHALTTVSDIASFDLETLGIAAQTHAAFPEQINFAAAQIPIASALFCAYSNVVLVKRLRVERAPVPLSLC